MTTGDYYFEMVLRNDWENIKLKVGQNRYDWSHTFTAVCRLKNLDVVKECYEQYIKPTNSVFCIQIAGYYAIRGPSNYIIGLPIDPESNQKESLVYNVHKQKKIFDYLNSLTKLDYSLYNQTQYFNRLMPYSNEHKQMLTHVENLRQRRDRIRWKNVYKRITHYNILKTVFHSSLAFEIVKIY